MTTPICRARDGLTLPASDDYWLTNWPPLHDYCRSSVRSITAAQGAARMKARGLQRMPDVAPMQDWGFAPPFEQTWTPQPDGFNGAIWTALEPRLRGDT